MPRRRRAASLLTATLEAQAAAWTVLAIRVPALLDGSASAAERTRMVAEKSDAMVESAQAVASTAMRLAVRPGKRRTSAMSAWLSLADAASRPFHTRVKANAKRLGRKPRSG